MENETRGTWIIIELCRLSADSSSIGVRGWNIGPENASESSSVPGLGDTLCLRLFSPVEDSLAVDSRRQLRFMTPTLVGIGYQLRVLIRALSCKIDRHFATFADLPYHDPLS